MEAQIVPRKRRPRRSHLAHHLSSHFAARLLARFGPAKEPRAAAHRQPDGADAPTRQRQVRASVIEAGAVISKLVVGVALATLSPAPCPVPPPHPRITLVSPHALEPPPRCQIIKQRRESVTSSAGGGSVGEGGRWWSPCLRARYVLVLRTPSPLPLVTIPESISTTEAGSRTFPSTPGRLDQPVEWPFLYVLSQTQIRVEVLAWNGMPPSPRRDLHSTRTERVPGRYGAYPPRHSRSPASKR